MKCAIENRNRPRNPARAAVERFGSPQCILISGGTDGNLDYKDWGKIVSKHVRAENIILLIGSATKKMLAELEKNTGVSKDAG